MWRLLIQFTGIFLVAPAFADSVIATRTIPARTIIAEGDLALVAARIPGAMDDLSMAVGLAARVALYAGRPVKPSEIGSPAILERNQMVTILFLSGSLSIRAEGRALERGGSGDIVRVMNVSSRTTVSGTIQPDGSIVIGLPQSR